MNSSQIPASRKRVIDQFEDAVEDEFVPDPDGDNDSDEDHEFLPDDLLDNSRKKRRKKKVQKAYMAKNTEKHHCSVCGRHDFVTKSGAARHQAECDGKPNPDGPWECTICGKNTFLTSQAFGGHWRCCNKGSSVTQAALSLRPEALQADRDKLSDFNKLITESIELFEASSTDVATQRIGNGRRAIELGNVGLRCRHCAELGVMTIGSIAYTNELKPLPHNMYTMVKRHLLETCKNVSEELRSTLLIAKKSSTSQSMTRGRIGLPAYLRTLITHFGLTDDGKKDGVRRRVDTGLSGDQVMRSQNNEHVNITGTAAGLSGDQVLRSQNSEHANITGTAPGLSVDQATRSQNSEHLDITGIVGTAV